MPQVVGPGQTRTSVVPSRPSPAPQVNGVVDNVGQRHGPNHVPPSFKPSPSVIAFSMASPSDSSSTSPEDNRELAVYSDPAAMHSYSAAGEGKPADARRQAQIQFLVKRFSEKYNSDRDLYTEKLKHYLMKKDKLLSLSADRHCIHHHEETSRIASQSAVLMRPGEDSVPRYPLEDRSWLEERLQPEQVDLIKKSSKVPEAFESGNLSLSADLRFQSKKTVVPCSEKPPTSDVFDPADPEWGMVPPAGFADSAERARSKPIYCDRSKKKVDPSFDRTKREAEVTDRVAELKRCGLWAEKRLPRVLEPPRPKTHWDYVLEEMAWMATDFAQERKWKKGLAKKVSKAILKQFQDQDQQADRKRREEEQKLRRIASFCAREVKNFWANVEKLVEFKTNTVLDAKRRKALDQHLNFVVQQTEKFSTMLAQGLTAPEGQRVENAEGTSGELGEVQAVQRESQMGIDELLDSLPPGYVESKLKELPSKDSPGDEDFEPHAHDTSDEEATIEEQEKHESSADQEKEIAALQAEAEIPIEELLELHEKAAAEIPESDGDGEDEEDEDAGSDDDEEDEEIAELKDLLEDNIESSSTSDKTSRPDSPSTELTDVAEMAAKFQPKGYTLSTAQVRTAVPFLLKHTLREYQHIGLDWLVTLYEKQLNGILADEMGLGKTIQTISLLAHLACEKEDWGPHLIVVPTSVMLNWEMEFKKWLPGFKILVYYGSQKERKLKRVGWTKPNTFHVCITSYQLILQDTSIFRRKKWKYLILDEAQNIKNFKSQRWQLLLNFQSQRRLLLTGTPLQNNLMELWSLMHFLMPNVFQSHKEFKEWFSNPMTGMIEGSQEYNENVIRRLHKVLRPFLLRRLKCEVEKQLPKKYEHVVVCKLSKRQRFLYEDYMSRAAVKDTLNSGNLLSVINVLMQLRKVCNHPNLFEERPVVSPCTVAPVAFTMPGMVAHFVDRLEVNKPGLFSFLNLNLFANRKYSAFAKKRTEELKQEMSVPIREFLKDRVSTHEEPPAWPVGAVKLSFRSFNPMYRRIKPISVFNVKRRFDILPKERQKDVMKTRAVGDLLPVPLGKEKSFGLGEMSVLRKMMRARQRQAVRPVQSGLPVFEGMRNLTPPMGMAAPSPQMEEVSLPASPASNSDGGLVLATPEAAGVDDVFKKPIIIPASRVHHSVFDLAVPSPSPTPPLCDEPMETAAIPSVSPLVYEASGKPAVQGIITSVTPRAKTAKAAMKRANSLIDTASLNSTPTVAPRPRSRLDMHRSVSSGNLRKPKGVGGVQKAKLRRKQMTVTVSVNDPEEAERKKKFYPESFVAKLDTMHKDWVNWVEYVDQRRFEVPLLMSWDTMMRCLLTTNLAKRRQVYRSVSGEDVFVEPFDERTRRGTEVNLRKWKPEGEVEGFSAFCGGLERCYSAMAEADAWMTLGFESRTNLGRICKSPLARLDEASDLLRRYSLYIPAAVARRSDRLVITHPSPSRVARQQKLIEDITPKMTPRVKSACRVIAPHMLMFPELRLIQYDCGKLQVLAKLLRDLHSEKHRVLIFTQMARVLDVLEAFLSFHGYRYLRLDGATKVDQRQVLMERFNMDPRIFCFILSTRSGGVGVNLTGADTVIFYDSDWNPTMDAQAQDRCHRIGQTRDVHIYRLISERTVEENILRKANQKRLLGDLAIEGGNFTTAHFKKNTIHDLFDVRAESDEFRLKDDEIVETVQEIASGVSSRAMSPTIAAKEDVYETALNAAEEDEDASAVITATAEATAELAEFDENGEVVEPVSKQEVELKQILTQLTPIEAYAVAIVERELEPWTTEKMASAEAEIENQKKEWEKNHLKAMHDAEKRRLEDEEEDDDEDDQEVVAGPSSAPPRKRARFDSKALTYASSEARNKVKKVPARRKTPAKKRNSRDGIEPTPSPKTPKQTRKLVVRLDRAEIGQSALPRSVEQLKGTADDTRRTRSGGAVHLDLWSLDVNPILPGVKPVPWSRKKKQKENSES